MKNKTETTLLAYSTAALNVLNSIPESIADEPEMTDEQIEALAETEVTENELSLLGSQLLADIHAEEPYFQTVERQNAKENWEDSQKKADNGLTTEINRSSSLVNVSDTMENVADLLRRHQFGYKNGSRNSKGQVIEKPYTEAETAAAEQLMECVKSGNRPIVAVEDGE
jgi:hypothetical protein